MTISLDTLLAGCRPKIDLVKGSLTTEGIGTWQSLWKATGNPTNGATPPAFSAGSGYIPTRATTGAIGQTNPTAPNQLRMVSLEASGTVAGKLIIYDRLWHCSGFSTVSVTTQSVTTPGSLTAGRLQDGVSDYSDVEMWLEVYSAPGATGANWTVVANDGGGASRSYVYAHPANAETVGQMIPMQQFAPSGAAPGIQQVTSFTASISSGTAGDVGITLLRRLAAIDLVANQGNFRSGLDLGLARIRDDACLAMMVQCTNTTSGIILGDLAVSDVNPS